MRKLMVLLCSVLVLAMVMVPVAAQDGGIVAAGETVNSPNDGATDAVVWYNSDSPADSLIVASDDDFGMVVYDLDGAELQTIALEIEGEEEVFPKYVDIRYNVAYGDEEIALVAAGIKDLTAIALFSADADGLELLDIVDTGVAHGTGCMYYSTLTDTLYLIQGDENGDFEQWSVDGSGGTFEIELAREFSVGSETEGCVADDELGNLFIAEEEVAIWVYSAEPEDGNSRAIVDAIGVNIDEEVEGLALYTGADGTGYLLAADEAGSSVAVYSRDGEEFIAEFTVEEGDIDGLQEPGGIYAINAPLNDTFDTGLFIAADDDNGEGNTNNFKLVPWGDIADALGLEVDTDFDPAATAINLTNSVIVTAAVETAPVPSGVDAADDAAIWVHPTDPDLSTVIGTDKTTGLVVYHLDGTILQNLDIGRINNVDVRYNFALGDTLVDVVTATNRTDNSIVVYAVNPETRQLQDIAAERYISPYREVYGLCMYTSPVDGRMYTIYNSTEGVVEQMELVATNDGRVALQSVRVMELPSQTEGCVADDEYAVLYVGEENAGIWKFGAEPETGDEGALVAVADGDPLTTDVEGLDIYYTGDGDGYLIASSQGSSEFIVYERTGDNALIGVFRVLENDEIDGVSGTDGIAVSNAPIGNGFEDGLFVTQDDSNINPAENQNFKLVRWSDIANALDLVIDTSFDFRAQ